MERWTAVPSLPEDMFNKLLIIIPHQQGIFIHSPNTTKNTCQWGPAPASGSRRSRTKGSRSPGMESHTGGQAPLRKECTEHICIYFLFFFLKANDKDPVYQLNFFKPKLNITYLNNCQNLLSCQHSCTTGKHPQCTLNQKCITINVLISSLLNTEKTEIILWKSHPGNVNFTAGWDYSAHVSNTMEKQSVLVLVYERVTATLDYV